MATKSRRDIRDEHISPEDRAKARTLVKKALARLDAAEQRKGRKRRIRRVGKSRFAWDTRPRARLFRTAPGIW
jgi:hypothetical protein